MNANELSFLLVLCYVFSVVLSCTPAWRHTYEACATYSARRRSVHLVTTGKCLNDLNLNPNLNPNPKILPLRLSWWLLSDSKYDSRSIGFVKNSDMHARIYTVYKKAKTRPFHHGKSLCAII